MREIERIAKLEIRQDIMEETVSSMDKTLKEVVAALNKAKGAFYIVMILGSVANGLAGEVLHHIWN